MGTAGDGPPRPPALGPPPPPAAASTTTVSSSSSSSSGKQHLASSRVASGFAGPPGHAVLRRAKTLDRSDSSPPRPRPPPLAARLDASAAASSDGAATRLAAPPRRRSSNLSDYSSEARDILNPRPSPGAYVPVSESSSLASLSLAFALLPAISGALFENGHAVVTDVMLLGLAGVFLHWSVTQPWYVGRYHPRLCLVAPCCSDEG